MPMSDGSVFAGYTIVGVLDSGAVGEVYLAQHPRLPRQEELTILAAAASADPDVRRRFEHEAGIAAGLSHPHISAVRDRGEHDGRLWFTTDHLNGTTAATLLHTDSPAGMPTEMVCDIVDALADALDYAHTEDLLHREVSPAHILLTDAGNSRRGRILLTDFGIARDTSETNLNTSTAALAYSSPEQLMGQPLDGRTDQYSLAATTYHLLTGSPPFAHTNTAVLISNHLNSPPPRLADTHPNLAALDPVLARALSKDPTDRYNTCTEFAQALTTAARTGHTPTTPPLAPPTADTTTETHDLPQPPTAFSDWGTPKPPPAEESPSAALLQWREGGTPAATPPPRPPLATAPPPPWAPQSRPMKESPSVAARATVAGVVAIVITVGIIAANNSDPDPDPTPTTTTPPKPTITAQAPAQPSAPPGWSAPSPLITDVDPAMYEDAEYPGSYYWMYATSAGPRRCGMFRSGVSCWVDFPPGTPYVTAPWSPTGTPPNAVKLFPPNGPENMALEGNWETDPAHRTLPPNHRITVGPFSCTALADDGIDCSAPTGGFQFEDGVLTKRNGD